MVSPSPVVSENDLCRLAADFELEFPKCTRQDFSTEPNYRRSYVVVIGRPLSNAANVVSSSFFFFPSPILSGRRLDVSHTSIHDVVLVGIYNCRSEMCCKRLAENTGRKNPASAHHCTNFAITSQLRHLSTIGKKLLNSNISSTRPHDMVNFGPLTAAIGWRVWGTPANFNVFRVLISLLHQRRSTYGLNGEVNQTLHDVWRFMGWYTIYAFSGALTPNGILPGAEFTLRLSIAFYIGSELHGTRAVGVRQTVSQTLRRATRKFSSVAITRYFCGAYFVGESL